MAKTGRDTTRHAIRRWSTRSS